MMRASPTLASIEIDRRITVATRENPRMNRDYLISLRKTRPFSFYDGNESDDLTILIQYVPDRLICDSGLLEQANADR